nr:MAG TPA: dUTPase [Caudoviricetes sp.]
MYSLGIEQFEGYRQIEKLPEAPLDVNNPSNQSILKDFIGRVIEELTEGFESTDAVVSIYHKYGWNNDCLTQEEYTEVLNHLANANEEQADALGFFFTLLIYSNILPEDILAYKVKKNLFDVMAEGVKELIIRYPDYQKVAKYPILNSEDWVGDVDQPEWDKIVSYTPGFHNMSDLSHESEKLYLWEIIYTLNKARNLLKCRTWKQTSVMTREDEFQESLAEAFYLYMGFLGMNGFNPKNLFELFFKKQRLNLWRQKTNY